jgi:transcriptional regulator GlxA family with amidase domain
VWATNEKLGACVEMHEISKTGSPAREDQVSKKVAFFVTPNFSPIGVFGAIEVLRTANRLTSQPIYGWEIVSHDGLPVASANGVTIVANKSIAEAKQYDLAIICAGFFPEKYSDEKTLNWIRYLDRHGAQLGAICTGTYVLAKAGVIKHRRCTIHGDNTAGFIEQFPEIELINQVFEIDRNLYTCAGGTSAIDLFINIVSEKIGTEFASSIAHRMQQDRVRNSQDVQSNSKRLDIRHKSPVLGKAIDLMEDNIEDPLATEAIARGLGISQRQLQRMFKNHIGVSPLEHYINLRVDRGHHLLQQTPLSIVEVAVACGFSTHGQFSRRYRARYGHSPSFERKNTR